MGKKIIDFKKLLIATAALSLAFVCPLDATAVDTNGRMGVNIKFNLDERVSFDVDEEFRLKDDAEEYYLHTEVGVGYRVHPWMSLGARFRQAFTEEGGDWLKEFRPQVQLVLEHVRKHFGILSRQRFENRIFSDRANQVRYRNKLEIGFPLIVGSAAVSPYVADEIFVELHDDPGFEKNRIYAGLAMIFAKTESVSYGLDLYYFWERVSSGPDRGDDNTIGIKFKVNFKGHKAKQPVTVEEERQEVIDETMDADY